ncbi:hypothetical protein HDV57DRAFT_160822 [Trichoderma longibrachiatum]|uniref:DUF7598 domain-containing protein n=1 Tax=Trichoderma longibrachiatum ATCC 18648 TaxID=983965 RepID=A0A2T4C145_TRILO|nr:hypothetical protein M440DRAFT_340446 [Trichoderma longibrachiatum ATCC 18648]
MAGFMNSPSLRGAGLVVLQALRVATVITLLTSGAACWILVINVEKHKPYFIFECFTLFFVSVLCSLLVVSELAFAQFIKIYLRRMWPVLSDHHGLSWLGLGMIIIGCNILGMLNHDLKMASALSSLVLAAGILALIFGFLNIVCSFIWCDRKEGITSRDIRANGSLARSQREFSDYDPPSRSSSSRNEKTRSKFVSMFWKKDKEEDYMNGQPEIAAPPYINISHHARDLEAQSDSPIIPGLKRPDTALHPMNTRMNSRSSRSSRYSEANMSRF